MKFEVTYILQYLLEWTNIKLLMTFTKENENKIHVSRVYLRNEVDKK